MHSNMAPVFNLSPLTDEQLEAIIALYPENPKDDRAVQTASALLATRACVRDGLVDEQLLDPRRWEKEIAKEDLDRINTTLRELEGSAGRVEKKG